MSRLGAIAALAGVLALGAGTGATLPGLPRRRDAHPCPDGHGLTRHRYCPTCGKRCEPKVTP